MTRGIMVAGMIHGIILPGMALPGDLDGAGDGVDFMPDGTVHGTILPGILHGMEAVTGVDIGDIITIITVPMYTDRPVVRLQTVS